MSKFVEISAKTTEEAIQTGLNQLGVAISDVKIDVVQEGSKGLFGLFGSRMAKVRLTLNEDGNDELDRLFNDEPKKPAVEKKPVAEKKPAAEKPAQEKKPAAEKPAQEKKPAAEKKQPAEKKPAAEKKQPAEKKPAGEKKQPVAEKKPAAEKTERKPLPPKAPVKPLEKPEVTMIPDDQVDAESAAGKAQAFLRELTHLMGVEVSVAVGNDKEGNVFANITGDTLGILIGRRGETLDALQYLTSLKVNRGQEGYTRVTIDTENYRAKREDTLTRLANRKANHAIKTGHKVSLEPMNPYERRIIHSVLQANDAVDTHSEGDEPNRHIVITLRK